MHDLIGVFPISYNIAAFLKLLTLMEYLQPRVFFHMLLLPYMKQ